MKLPKWLMKGAVKNTTKPKTQKRKAKVTKAGPPPEMWVGWPMDEEFNPNILDHAHIHMMQKLGRRF